MRKTNLSYFALIITGLALSLTGCGQKREFDPRTQPELVRIVEIGSSSGADPAFTGVRRLEQIPHSQAWFQRVFRAILVSEFPERSRAAW